MVIPPDRKGLCGERKMLYSIQKVDIHSPKGHGIPTQTASPPQRGALTHHALVVSSQNKLLVRIDVCLASVNL